MCSDLLAFIYALSAKLAEVALVPPKSLPAIWTLVEEKVWN